MPFAISSPAFDSGQPIPAVYTCDGSDISPPLVWRDPPPGTRSFVLVVEDPDAPGGVFRHWGVYAIPATQTTLPPGAQLGRQHVVVNDFDRPGYGGPCPPQRGGVHHYRFRLAALDRETLTVAPNADVAALWRAASPYVIAKVELVGTYSR